VTTPHWPLLDLRVVTPRLELRPPDQATALALIDLATKGIHDPGSMPFANPWTEIESPRRERESFQYYARTWAEWTPEHWQLPFGVWVGDELVGLQTILADGFARRRTFETGSWVSQARQGEGIGKEMRAAVVHFGFAGLGADRAETSAFFDNHSSQAVTRAIGYEANGDRLFVRGEGSARMLDFKLERGRWEASRRHDITITGLEPCLELFGIG
jgi:RimJ/RimL family protein N-acetyltransferase